MSQPSNPKAGPARLTLPRGRWLVLIAVVIVAAAAAAYYFLRPPDAGSTVTLERGDIHAVVTANARARAIRLVHLSFPFSGMLARVPVQEGDAVKSGDVVAELASDDFDRRIKQAELTLKARQLDLERAKAPPRSEELDIAQASLKRAALALGLAEDNAKKNPSDANDAAREAAQADYDIAKDNLDRLTRGPSDQDLQALNNAINQAQIDLDAARTAKGQTQLRAPFDGIITEVNAQAGELFGAYNPLIGIADTARLDLLVDIDEIDVGGVMSGQSVEIRFDTFPGSVLQGKVEQVFPAASTQRGALVYQARVSFDRGGLAIRPGMGATVKIATVEKKGVWLLPTRAIKTAGTQKIVAALIDGSVRNVVIQTGLSDGNQTEVIGGLDPGTRVVVD